jgi:protocatechuate 3,4-dioxygenase beta subunit
MKLRKPSLPPVAILATFIVLMLLLTPSSAATQGPLSPGTSASEPVPGVYWVRLRSPAPALSADLLTVLRELRAEGRVLSFEHLPGSGSLRVIAVPDGIEVLARHPEVAKIDPPYLRPKRPIQEPAQAGGTAQTTYRIRGTVRDHDGVPLKEVSVYTSWNDPDDAWANSDASGVYELTVGVAGTYLITAYKSGLPSPPKRMATVPPDTEGIDFTFPPTYTLSGFVRDQDGHPVTGATIYGDVGEGTSAADGSYTIVEGPGEPYVSAYKDGYQSPYSVVVPVPPAATDVDLLLLREDGTIYGRIVDDRGTPVDWATVWADSVLCDDWDDIDGKTGADGSYTLTVPAGIYHVGASKEAYASTPSVEVTVPSGAPAVRVDLVLKDAPHTIGGTVYDGAGQPAEDVRVTASMCGVSYGTWTDASGMYTLSVEAGIYSVVASSGSYNKADAQQVSVPPDASGIDFMLPAHAISGRVTDPAGQPIEHVRVQTSQQDDPYYSGDWTDAAGRYTLPVPPGNYHVIAFEYGYTRPVEQIVIVPPDRRGVDFVLAPTGLTMRGTIRDTSGAALPTAWVFTFLEGESSSWGTRAYYNGTYVRGMITGTHEVHVSADCRASAWVRDVTFPPSRTGIDFSLAPADQLISGIVKDTGDTPVCDARVYAQSTGDDVSDYDYAARNGRYALQVPAGTYTLQAYKAGYGSSPNQTVTVPPYAQGTDLTLRAPSNVIRGTVRDHKGTGVAGATAVASGSEGNVSASTAADGQYTIQVIDGSWTVSAAKVDYVTFTAPRSVSVPPDRSGIDFVMVPDGDVQRVWLPLVRR